MAGVFEIYDNEQVQLVTRREAAVTFAIVAGAITSLIVLVILARESLLPGWVALLAMAAVAGVGARRILRHMLRTNHVVWCVKLSEVQIAGYDYARRETSVCWTDVRQIELGDGGLRIRGTDDRHIDIPHLFADFSALSHRIVEYAERYEVPILIDGRPVEDLDLYILYPFLAPGVGAR